MWDASSPFVCFRYPHVLLPVSLAIPLAAEAAFWRPQLRAGAVSGPHLPNGEASNRPAHLRVGESGSHR